MIINDTRYILAMLDRTVDRAERDRLVLFLSKLILHKVWLTQLIFSSHWLTQLILTSHWLSLIILSSHWSGVFGGWAAARRGCRQVSDSR